MIEVTQQGAVHIVRLAHGKASALDTELCDAIAAQFEQLRAASGAIVLTGTGGIFSAGVDLRRVIDGGAAYLDAFLPALTSMLEIVFLHPQPVVAAINGHAIAGGCVLACAADRRLMAPGKGRIGITELLVGVPFPTTALEIMRATCAPQHLQRLVYDGTTVAAADAVGLGLVDEVVDAEALLDRAVAQAEALLAIAPDAFALSKRQLRGPARERTHATRPVVDPDVDAIWQAEVTRAAIGRYVERTLKRPS
ncbi:MAG: enoyl-CoA hydratase/isomerase family protein [bacterium]